MNDFPKIPDEDLARQRFEELTTADFRRRLIVLSITAARSVQGLMVGTVAAVQAPRDRFDAWTASDWAETERLLQLNARVCRDFATVVDRMCQAVRTRRDNPGL